MTTVRIYKSWLADDRLIVRRKRKHGRPRGHKRAWRVMYRVEFPSVAEQDRANVEALLP